jgi:hypothetical protein
MREVNFHPNHHSFGFPVPWSKNPKINNLGKDLTSKVIRIKASVQLCVDGSSL